MRSIFFLVVLSIGCGGKDPSEPLDAADDSATCTPPTRFTFAAIGERSFASFGWTGTVHNVRVPDGTPFGVEVTSCDGCDGVCSFTGPIAPVSPVERRRCLNRMSTTCQTSSDCPDDGTPYRQCVFIYDAPAGSPLTGAGGKVGACGWSYIPIAEPGQTPTVTGTLDQASGELNLTSLTIFLPLNGRGGTYRGGCAECIGDDIANDGVKNGTCMPSTHGQASDPSLDLGRPCDIHRFGSITGFEANYSMDCAPTVATADGAPNIFGGLFTSSGYQLELTDASPDCTDPNFAGEKCFCGACPDGITSCLNDAECGGAKCGFLPDNCDPNPFPFRDDGTFNTNFNTSFGPGQCRTAGTTSHVTVGGNSCRNGICNWDEESGLGSCISKLTNTMVGCYPHGLGQRVLAVGGARKQGNVYIADTATARCNRISPSPVVNGQLGLPGLTFQKRSFRIIPETSP